MNTNLGVMKNQTFGVEVEMADISRRSAAAVVARYFGSTSKKVNETYYCVDRKGRSWKFVYDGSIRSNTRAQSTEMVTPILKYDDMEDLQAIIRLLRKAGAVSNPKRGCGVHIHVGAEGHTPTSIRNLVNIMASREKLFVDSMKIDYSRIRRYCGYVDERFLEELNSKKPSTMSELADVWYRSFDSCNNRNAHYHPSRYKMLNLHSTFTKGTIEFRMFQFDNPTNEKLGGLHAGKLKSYIQLCLAISAQAKAVKSASSKAPQTENPKYAMRTWLLRLGFIGDEFKTARTVLTERLSGNLAWR